MPQLRRITTYTVGLAAHPSTDQTHVYDISNFQVIASVRQIKSSIDFLSMYTTNHLCADCFNLYDCERFNVKSQTRRKTDISIPTNAKSYAIMVLVLISGKIYFCTTPYMVMGWVLLKSSIIDIIVILYYK